MKNALLYGFVLGLCGMWSFASQAAEFSITLDDPHLYKTPLLSPSQRNQAILKQLRRHKARAMLFVCGKRIDHRRGKKLLRSWSRAGHWLANHSYSHRYFHSSKVSLAAFQRDLQKNHQLLRPFSRFLRIFRFPYLKEGNTLAKRDGMRRFLKAQKYRNGHVSIDASDWYIDLRLRKKLKRSPTFPRHKYRDYYLSHIWERARYYDGLSKKLLGRSIKHALLLHHNLLNALYLGDLIAHLKGKGWKLIDAKAAYGDPVYGKAPQILPAGESLLWALARKKGLKGLRYPAESGKYEKPRMKKLGL